MLEEHEALRTVLPGALKNPSLTSFYAAHLGPIHFHPVLELTPVIQGGRLSLLA